MSRSYMIPLKIWIKKSLWFNIQYYCWIKPKDWYYDLRWFFKNLYKFRKHLWNYRSCDSTYCIELFADSLDWVGDCINNGHEENRSANKKVDAIRELTKLLRKTCDDNDYNMWNEYFDDEKKEFSITIEQYNKEYEQRRNQTYKRIFEIIKGQDKEVFKDTNGYDEWVEKFDGTGIESWWD